MRIGSRPIGSRSTRGFVLVAFLALLTTGLLYFLVSQLNGAAVARKREDSTAQALADAKAALIGFAASVTLPSSCASSCARPGELPCPDVNDPSGINAGNAGSNCGASPIGRLPFKKLGIPDLRDDSGERLWYAVSTNFLNSPRTFPLNSDTAGSISIVDGAGNVIASDVVAVVMAPEAAIQREGAALVQVRFASATNADAYLDIHAGTDNAAASALTFMAGPVFSPTNPQEVIVNDRLLWISRTELMTAVQKRVLGELRAAMKEYLVTNSYLPNPVLFNDTSCIPTPPAKIPSGCLSDIGTTEGRIPADAWSGSSLFLNGDNFNWFQKNGWRESIYFYLSPKCGTGTTNCNGTGVAPTLDSLSQCVVIVSGGKSLVGPRPNQTSKPPYFEGINATNGGSFISKDAAIPFNDLTIGFCPAGISP
jgi:hypothetical protein